jgi:hypothetical protein
MKLIPREPGDQNATMLHALVVGEIAIRQAQANKEPDHKTAINLGRHRAIGGGLFLFLFL